MNNRLKQFLLAENISQSQFADTIGVARASISHILSGRNKPGFEFFTNIARHYPNLNLTWLITGKGRMYGNGQTQESYVAVPSAATSESDNSDSMSEAGSNLQDVDLFSGMPGQDIDEGSRTSRTKHSGGNDKLPETAVSGRNTAASAVPSARRITKVVIFYDDNTYQEMK